MTPCSASCGATSQASSQRSAVSQVRMRFFAGDRSRVAAGSVGAVPAAEDRCSQSSMPRICSSLRHRLTSLKRFWRLARSSVDQAGGGALGGGGGIVELVGQVAGQLAQGGELFGLLLDAGHLAHAVEQRGDDALRHGRDGPEHLGNSDLWNGQRPAAVTAKPWPPELSCARRAEGRSSARRGR